MSHTGRIIHGRDGKVSVDTHNDFGKPLVYIGCNTGDPGAGTFQMVSVELTQQQAMELMVYIGQQVDYYGVP